MTLCKNQQRDDQSPHWQEKGRIENLPTSPRHRNDLRDVLGLCGKLCVPLEKFSQPLRTFFFLRLKKYEENFAVTYHYRTPSIRFREDTSIEFTRHTCMRSAWTMTKDFFGGKCNNSRFNMSESEYSSEDDEDYVPGTKWRHCAANLGHHDQHSQQNCQNFRIGHMRILSLK